MGSYDFMLIAIPIIGILMFVLVFGIIVAVIIGGIAQWNKNNHSPILTVDAKIVAKRADISHHTDDDTNDRHMSHTSTSTTYHATFEVESGDRLEFIIGGLEYGLLAEHDTGKLKLQGTRYLGFERINTVF